MADINETEMDPISSEEMTSVAVPPKENSSTEKSPRNSNAFAELMAPKPTKSHTPKRSSKGAYTVFDHRDGLGAYLKDPTAFPPERVIYHNDKWVVINDLYPKSSIHLLLLPRDSAINKLHPFDALEDPEFLASAQAEVKYVKSLAAKELRRKFGTGSTQEKPRLDAMEANPPPEVLPDGRDWDKEVISGVHAVPSMNHLHIHVLSVDRVSECMKHTKHYNSFATPFLVDVKDFPLAADDVRRHPGRQGYLHQDLRCWKCGRDFGNRFAKLKTHLQEEFGEWKTA
ncbi:MAG: aprataxin-like protein [Piccolia ochrophora]|nr:MAG: aprataxin-like protein [Piccolia ochrophora]